MEGSADRVAAMADHEQNEGSRRMSQRADYVPEDFVRSERTPVPETMTDDGSRSNLERYEEPCLL